MPRKSKEERKRERGYFYFDNRSLKKSQAFDDIISMLFSGVPAYREIASFIMNSIRYKAVESKRVNPYWVTTSELSKMMTEGLGPSRKPMAYKVLYEFLIPYGLIRKEESENRYYLARDFSLALRKIADSYDKWLSQ
ncbi:MAG: hypothetical protein RXR41_01870 [Candidatus Marsarchaeota archaeon]|jgi:hypothetical protein